MIQNDSMRANLLTEDEESVDDAYEALTQRLEAEEKVKTKQLPSWLDGGNLTKQKHFENAICGPTRKSAVEIVESRLVQTALIFLLILDIVIVIAKVVLETNRACKLDPSVPFNSTATPEELQFVYDFTKPLYKNVTNGLQIMSIVILCIFGIELVVLIFCYGLSFFKKALYVLDLIVVTISLILDLALNMGIVGSLLVIFRAWRLLRIARGVYMSVGEQKKAKRKREQRKISNYIDSLKRHNKVLKEELERLRPQSSQTVG